METIIKTELSPLYQAEFDALDEMLKEDKSSCFNLQDFSEEISLKDLLILREYFQYCLT